MKLIKDMTEEKIFLADTYALIELIGGNINYKLYLNYILLTTKFNLIELYYYCLNNYSKEIADKYLKLYKPSVIPMSYNSIRYGMEFKLKHKKERLGYVDCIGYALSIELGVRFLTGDQKFKDKSNVEYIK